MKRELESLLSEAAAILFSEEPKLLAEYLAPWMDGEDFVSSFVDQKADVLSIFDYTTSPDVEETNVDDGDATYEEVIHDTSLPAEVTTDNFRHWAYIQFVFEEDSEGLQAAVDVWVAVVDVDGALKIGSYEFVEGD